MDKIQELKQALLKARITVVARTIPNGHCPNAYYNIDYISGCKDENEITCEECKQRFFTAIKKEILKEIEQEFNI